jgi:hypothetical protein
VKVSLLVLSFCLITGCANSDFSGTTATSTSKPSKTKDSPVDDKTESEEIETDDSEQEKKKNDPDKNKPGVEKTDDEILNESTGESEEFVCADRSYRINNQCIDAVPVYHWENTLTNKHLYTLTATQVCQSANPETDPVSVCGGEAVQGGGWRYVALEFYTTPNDAEQIPGLSKFYRLYKHTGAGHFYTTDDAERDEKIADAFALEITHQIFSTKQKFTVPLNRWRNTASGQYLYSVTLKNSDTLAGWTFEKISGYVFK